MTEPEPKPKVKAKAKVPIEPKEPAPDKSLTFWNGVPVAARKVRVIVADNGSFPNPWFRHLVGQERDAVEVSVDNGQPFYLDNADGSAWRKLTDAKGSSRRGSSSLDIKEVL